MNEAIAYVLFFSAGALSGVGARYGSGTTTLIAVFLGEIAMFLWLKQ